MGSESLQYFLSVHPCLLPLTPILERIHLYFQDWPNNRPNSRPIGRRMEIGRARIQTALKQAISPASHKSAYPQNSPKRCHFLHPIIHIQDIHKIVLKTTN